jgi:hypothetical protein
VIIDLPSPVALVCHDAGAANHIVAWLRADGCTTHTCAYMAGPARKIWEEAFGGSSLAPSLATALNGAASLLSGTGWATDIEHEARRMARQSGLRVIAMIDHWTNYASRFVRAGTEVLPDEIWVVDEYAQQIASATFPTCRIRRKTDVYTQQLVAGLPPVAELTENQLLYALEPMRTDWGRAITGEFQALDYFLEHLALLELPADTLIRLRPHPSDPPGKYDAYLSRSCAYRITLDHGDLKDSIASARWVAGCESFALTLALQAGRTVLCSLPPWAPPCRLPHAGLVHLKNIRTL